MIAALDDGGQVILLLNRRGFHTFILCPNPCGQVAQVRRLRRGADLPQGPPARCSATPATPSASRPPACPSCRAAQLHYGGIGTERLEREVRTAFPDHVARRMDSDTMRTPGEPRAGALRPSARARSTSCWARR